MTTRGTYLQYKQDEQYLVYWITRSTARVAKKFSLESAGLVSADGGITLSALLSCSELIAKYVSPIPSTIFRIFASVIKARKERHEAFVRLAENNPAPEVLKSNTTHKIWLEGLSEAFRLLGGHTWQENTKLPSDIPDEDKQQVITNMFSPLEIDEETKYGSDDRVYARDEEDNSISAAATGSNISHKRARQECKKTAKARGRRAKATANKPDSSISVPKDLQLEIYRIIDKDGTLCTEYYMAAHSLVEQMLGLRYPLQGI